MKKPTKTSLAAALQSLAPPMARQAGEFTAYDAAAEWKMSLKGASSRLRALKSSGAVVGREGRENGKVVTFYRKP